MRRTLVSREPRCLRWAPLAAERGCTVLAAVWGADYVAQVDAWRQRFDPFLDELESQGHRARVLLVDNASEPPVAPDAAGTRGDVVRLGQRRSIGAARNAGLLHVDTDVISFVDIDDQSKPESMERQYCELVRADPDTVGIFGRFERTDPRGGRFLGSWPHPWALSLLRHPRLFATLTAVINELPVTQAPMLRSAAVIRAGGFADLSYGEDWFLGARLAQLGSVRFAADAEPTAYESGVLSQRQGTRQVFNAYEDVRRALLAAPRTPPGPRIALRTAGPMLNAVRAALEGRRG